MFTRQLVLITKKCGDVSSHSLALVRELKEERLFQTLSFVSREPPCWLHRSAFLVTRDETTNSVGIIKNHAKIVDVLKAADKR